MTKFSVVVLSFPYFISIMLNSNSHLHNAILALLWSKTYLSTGYGSSFRPFWVPDMRPSGRAAENVEGSSIGLIWGASNVDLKLDPSHV